MKIVSNLARVFIVIAIAGCAFLACKKDNSTPPANPVDSTSASITLKKGLMLYLPFDGSLADSSGNANSVVAVAGGGLTYDEHGWANSAFGGTGNGERLFVTNNGSIKIDTAFSISLHFMVRTYGYQAFVTMVEPSTGHAPGLVTGILGNYNPDQNLLDFAIGDSARGCDQGGAKDATTEMTPAAFVPATDAWYNMVGVYHGGQADLYINGTLLGSKVGNFKKPLSCPNAKIVIGGWWDGGPITINGKLDEIRLYNRVLTAAEIKELAKDFQN